ncbi:MAG: hypothetical protein K2Z81_03155 [Cyanobacteria bacterium]|nr:hypothetical protein [Cyanobacteriota bacterium]
MNIKSLFKALLLSAMVIAVGATASLLAFGSPEAGAPSAKEVPTSSSLRSSLMLAQAPTPATTGGAAAPAPPTGYPYDDDPSDAGGVKEDEKDLPKPHNPVRQVLADGKIQILLGNSRHFGNRIGDHIPITILIATQDNVQLDFTSLKQGQLGFDGSDFELVSPARVRSQKQKDGVIVYRIDLMVRTWVPKDAVIFTLDLRYATEMTPDGKTPNWKRMTTPEFVVSRSRTADNGEELLEGDLEKKTPGQPWATYPLLVMGIFLVLLWPGLAVVKFINRVRPRKVLPPRTAAWRVFDRVFKDAKANGFTTEHYKQILAAVRRYLSVTKGVPIEPATFLEIQDRLEADSELELIESVLSKCERVVYAGDKMGDDENRTLMREIEKLVPRHWDST